jgi:predicted negative regulator of RcsB-dependent stress response
MSSAWMAGLEIVLVLGVVVGLGGWDLWRLRKEQARDRARDHAASVRDAASGKATSSEPSQR